MAGAATDHRQRLLCWSAAAAIDLIGTLTAHPLPGRRLDSHRLTFASAHLAERCRLFLLIALGETILTTGTALVTAPLRPLTLLSGGIAVTGTTALWWTYFRYTEPTVRRHAATTDDPVRTGRFAVLSVLVMVGGLIAVAVGDELVIAHPTGHTTAATVLLMFGGPILFLGAQGWYLLSIVGLRARSRAWAVTALAAIAAPALLLPPLGAAALATAILLAVAAADTHTAHRPRWEPEPGERRTSWQERASPGCTLHRSNVPRSCDPPMHQHRTTRPTREPEVEEPRPDPAACRSGTSTPCRCPAPR